MGKTMSRRGFVGGIAAGTAAAALGFAGSYAKADDVVQWADEADIVFVGSGGAGMFGAMKAHELGCSTMIVEKTDRDNAGGDTSCYGGIVAPASYEGSAWTFPDPERAALLGAAADEVLAFVAETLSVTLLPGNIVEGSGKAMNAALRAWVEDLGIPIVYDAPAVALVKDDVAGEIVGVVTVQNGERVCYKANKAVVLTTGGYESNPDMINYLHYPKLQTVSVGHPAITGDGIAMANAVGAGLSCIGTSIEWFEFAFAAPSRELGTGIANRQWSTFDGFGGGRNVEPCPSKIFVNMDGNRFMDETTLLTHNKTIGLAHTRLDHSLFTGSKGYVNMPMFLICDSSCIEGGPLGTVPSDNGWTYAVTSGTYQWSDDNSAEIEKGWLIKADTIEELAAKLTATDYVYGEEKTIDPAALKATVDAYNAACDEGCDPMFGRGADTLVPIAKPPFYAAEMMPCIVYTINGLTSGTNSQVLDWAGQPIGRLYCAGNIGQGVDLTPYNATGAFAAAMVAAEHAAALAPRG